MLGNLVISPISIDLGARNTGVYFAHYPEGSSIEEIEKEGRVYQLEKDSYTLLMANRTARRHQRRGFDRRQMVKRLFRLIWEKHFGLPWDKTVQQTISFLFNRRGFSFLTEEYDAEILSRFPEEAHTLLPYELQIASNDNGEYDFSSALTEWANSGEEEVRKRFDAISKKPKYIAQRLVFIGRTKKLKEYCQKRQSGNTIPAETRKILSNLSKWIWDEWQRIEVQGLDETFIANDQGNGSEIEWKNPISFDLVTYLNQESPEIARQILETLPNTSTEENKLKACVWNFTAENFKLEGKDFSSPELPEENATQNEKRDYEKANFEWKRLHLQHLAFALGKTLNELESGGRHRSKYFEEVQNVLKNKCHTHGYLKAFCEKLHSDSFKPLNVKSLTNLIGHLSNLELKPLRKYYNDKGHKSGDYWDEQRLKKFFDRWILHEWRVNLEKDKKKAPTEPGDYKKLCREGSADQQDTDYPREPGDYKKLCRAWKAHQGTVVDFWLKTDPVYTIPPYQDNNNRRPPRCQSLILNPAFLDNHYSEWQMWLGVLKDIHCVKEYMGNYEEELNDIKSGKGRSYFSDEAKGELKKDSGRRTLKDLNARLLQFIFDRVKADDPLNLNEIYSHAKKYRQRQSTEQEREDAKNKLEKAIQDSELPDTLKIHRDYQSSGEFKQDSFLHLTCKYYKIRQKAKDGRVFIHPEYRYVDGRGYENTGRFDDKDHLLTYCNHKPRQKRHQMLGDLAGLLQIAPKQLEKFVQERDGKTVDEKLFNWLKGIDNLKTNCDRAAKEQKGRRGRLKLDIHKIFGLIYHRRQNDSPSAQEIREILRNSNVDEASKLHSFCERARSLCLTVTQGLYEDSKQRQCEQDLKRNPANAVYRLVQINDIAFKERSGNANTCAVCSTDNAQRMQMLAREEIEKSHAKAQRLPAIGTRLIDGAAMRMARIVGGAIAKDKWEKIQGRLQAGNHVCVPIITESNRFEFEPNLRELKNKSRREDQNLSGQVSEKFAEKEGRIKEANRDCICPYNGTPIGNNGEIDHIIPRSSERGTLNDEANLIWASHEGNHHKTNTHLSLGDLHQYYKDSQFDDQNDDEITTWIEAQIGTGEGGLFKFGSYRSFINLTADEQKAFRHALFLVNHPLREKVINAIDNRNRALVNGTQRHFAEMLANNLYKKAKAIDKQHLLSFDYFGVEAQDSSRGGGIYHLRKRFETVSPEVQNYRKGNGNTQELYSHLIDAQLAFAIVADAHRNEGGLKLRIDNSVSLWPVDGTVANTIFNAIRVAPDELHPSKLKRRKPDENYFSHRSIHRDNMYAEHYVPILIDKKTGEVHIGFDWNNSYPLRDTKPNRITLYFALQQFGLPENSLHLTKDTPFHELAKQLANAGFSSKTNYFSISFNVQAIHAYYIENYNTAKGYQEYSDKMKFLRKLAYRTEKKKIETLQEAEKILNTPGNFQIKNPKPILPVKEEWKRLVAEWKRTDLEAEAFLRKFFREPLTKKPHEKVRKVFSLPIKTDEGKFLLKRNSWNGEDVFQIVNDSDSRKVDAKAFIPVFIRSRCSIGKVLSESTRSDKLFLLSDEDYCGPTNDDIKRIDPEVWHSIELNDELRALAIGKLEYRIDNNTRPQVRLIFNKKPKHEKIETILGHPLLKPKEKAKLKTQLQKVTEEDKIIEYTGSGFQQDIKQKLLPVLQEYYSRNVSS